MSTSGDPIFNVRLSVEHRAHLAAIAKHLGGLTAGACLRLLIAEKYDAIKDSLPMAKSREPEPTGLTYDSSPDFSQ